MIDDGLGDWRKRAVTRLTQDIPPAFPGGPSHESGTPAALSMISKDSDGHAVHFIAPSSVALSLNLAIAAATEAAKLRSGLVYEKVYGPKGLVKSFPESSMSALYNYFESCMTTVIFSYQSIETYCNEVLSPEFGGPESVRVNIREFPAMMSSEHAQGFLSTKQKVSTVIPDLLSTKSPKGTRLWEGFIVLEKVRNSIIHLKSNQTYSRDESIDTIFSNFLTGSMKKYPRTAIEMMEYFSNGRESPRWLRLAREALNSVP